MPEKPGYARPRSNRHILTALDRRTRHGRLLRDVRADLVKHCGGNPSPVETALIERAAMLTLHTALFDAKALDQGGLSEEDSKKYLAYSNSLTRTLTALGLKGATSEAPTLAEYWRDKKAAGGGSE